MLNGIPINDIADQLGGIADLSTIVAFNVDRIEIVREGMFAVHGSESIGSVVNVQ